MSEITKLYKNANIEKEVIKGCYDYYSKLGIDIWKENDCAGKNCDTCKKDKSIKKYPPFTAEKQLRLTTFIGLHYGFQMFKNEAFDYIIATKIFVKYEFEYKGYGYGYDEAIANLINNLWQDLTEEEKQQVKGILE